MPDIAAVYPQLSVGMTAQCVVSDTLTLTLTEDAYAVGAVLEPEWAQYDLECRLDRQTLRDAVRQQIGGEIAGVVDTAVYLDAPYLERDGGAMRVKAPMTLRVLYQDASGALQGTAVKSEAAVETALCENARCFASAFACGAFTFLLGGGLVEMFCAFWGAGIGHFIRCKLIKRHLTLFLNIMVSVSAACVSYTILFRLLEMFLHVRFQHEAGYICSMLFIIPGFPFITCGIDLAKLDMRSGLERLMYALIIITVATMTAWILAVLLRLHPTAFLPQNLFLWQQILFRLVASFCGVFGFSMMFNSPLRLAAAAGLIGAFSNTLRLELVDLCSMAPAAAAFLGAFCSGLAASAIKGFSGFPRIALTVPSIVIMVPGLYLYKSFYNLGVMNLTGALQWLCMATLIVLALPLGLVAARILTDRNFRHCT